MISDAATFGLAAFAGLALGSYAVTAAVRFARAEPSARGRSHCDHCGAALSFAQTIPLISYVWARGHCGGCRARIDPIHTAGELGGLIVVLTAASIHDPIRFLLLTGLGLLLVAAATIDLKIGRLPNLLTGAAAAAALALAATKSTAAVEAGLVAAAIMLVLLQGLRVARTRQGRDPGLGGGDLKLIAGMAFWLGIAAPWMLVGAVVLSFIAIGMNTPAGAQLSGRRLAFGPALAAAGWMVGMGGEWKLWPTTV